MSIKSKGKHGGARPNSGPKKGAKYNKTQKWEAWGKAIIDDNMPYINQKLETMVKEDKFEEFTEHFYKLLEYFKPKLSRTEIRDPENVFKPVIYLPELIKPNEQD